MKKIAIFDIDGTIFRSSLLIELTEALIHAGIFKPAIREYYNRQYRDWLDRRGSYEKYIDGVVAAFMANIKGVSHKDFVKVAKKVIARKQHQTYRYTRDLVKSLKKKNYFVVAISNSPKDIVETFCREWGFSKTYGRIYETEKKGLLTGKIVFQDIISDKAKVLKRVIEKESLTLKGSIGVGDTGADIRFLKMVDKPICFNPNRELYTYAKRAKWKVVVERKDVIYEI